MKIQHQSSNIKQFTCVGAGLVALDVVISANNTSTKFYAGGSCGNVLTILSFLGWQSYPVARLSNNVAGEMLWEDFEKWNVNGDLLTFNESGSTPIIIHRILKDARGIAKHRFEFRNPEDGSYLPSYKPWLAKEVSEVLEKQTKASVFYFDRINRSSIELAKQYKTKGALIFFEPSSVKDEKGFDECLAIADIIKFSEERIPNYSDKFRKGIAPLEIQTLGEKGLQYRKSGNSKWNFVPSFYIDNVVDTAGAGDWCTAGIIFSIFTNLTPFRKLTNQQLAYCFNFGQALSALNCVHEGARGLMYDTNKQSLLLTVNHIVSSDIREIHVKKTNSKSIISDPKKLKISSLFAHV